VIAKGKTSRCLSRFRSVSHSSIIPAYSNKGWTTSTTWLQLINDIILPHLNNQPGVIVCDVYGVHKTATVTSWCEERNIEVLYVPPGLTSTRQPLDVKVFGPLKSVITKMWGDARINDPLAIPQIEQVIPMFRHAYQVECMRHVWMMYGMTRHACMSCFMW
jgi:hypothetical protein